MTRLLLRLFADDGRNRGAVGKLAGIVGLMCNLILFAGKLTVGLLSASVSVTADAVNNLSDASSSIVTLIGFKLSEKPADEDHPFGHARFEYLSGLAVAALILVIGVQLGRSSIERIIRPEAVEFSALFAAVLVISVLLKLWLAIFYRKLGKKIDSTALIASADDSRNDIISTCAVLIAAAVERLAGIHIDGFAGLAVAVFIVVSGVKMAKETVSPLLGEGASPELKELIVGEIRNNPHVLGYHDLMVHDYGPNHRFASLHLEMDYRTDALKAHEMIDDMERECFLSHGIHLVIHYDPVITDDPDLNRFHEAVVRLLSGCDPRLHVHDFRMVRTEGHINLVFDVVLPADLKGRERELRTYLEEELTKQEGTRIYTVITFDPESFN